jgi:uncharacterized damage-inducible protein DinB
VANDLVMSGAAGLSDEQLDRPLDLGMGSLRKIMQHLLAGEVTWLARISGEVEAKWPARAIPAGMAEMSALLSEIARERQALMRRLGDEQLDRVQRYRDSRGSLFEASLRQMVLQMIIHATHHRAQVVNAIRRVGGQVPEVDFMHQVRREA